MPNWKKVIVSGSNAILNHITASGDISSSGTITAKTLATDQFVNHNNDPNTRLSFGSDTLTFTANTVNKFKFNNNELTFYDDVNVTGSISASDELYAGLTYESTGNGGIKALVYDTGSGRFYYTGSYGGGGSGGVGGVDHDIQFNNAGTIDGHRALTFYQNADGGTSGLEPRTVFRHGRDEPANANAGNKTGNNFSGSFVAEAGSPELMNARVPFGQGPIIFTGFGTKRSTNTALGNYGVDQASEYLRAPVGVTDYGLPTDGIEAYNMYGDVIPGEHTLSSMYGYMYSDGRTKLYAHGFVTIPSSPGIVVDENGFQVYPSASVAFDSAGSGSFITPLASASGRITLTENATNPERSILDIIGRGNIDIKTGDSGSEANILVINSDNKTVGVGPITDSFNDNNLKTSNYSLFISGGLKSSGGINTGIETDTFSVSGKSEQKTIYALSSSTATYGYGQNQDATSGFIVDSGYAYTHVTPQIQSTGIIYWAGVQGDDTSGNIKGYPDNYLTYLKSVYQSVRGGGSTPNDRTFVVDDSDLSISKDTGEGGKTGILFTSNPNIYFFNTDSSASISGSLLAESASAQIKFDTGSSALKFLAGSTKEDLKEVMFISKSGDNPKIGIGTTTPKATFDIKEVEDANTGTRFLLKSARTSIEGAQVGDSAGSINFAIDSASFNDIFTSGSVASIDSIVKSIEDTGDGVPNVAGNLIIKSSPEWVEVLKNVAEIGFHKRPHINPGEDSSAGIYISGALIVGGENSSQGDIKPLEIYGRSKTSVSTPTIQLAHEGNILTLHSSSFIVGSGSISLGETYSGTNQVEVLNLRGGNSIKFGHISGGGGNHGIEFYASNTQYAKLDTGGNFGIGTTQNTAPEKLTVEGNISASGDITVNNGSFLGNLTVDGNITANQYIVSSSVTYLTQSFSSGSTIFGDTLDDTHQFTGSILYTGSLDINGMTYPTTDGNDGQVLLTDGDGVLTFGDVKVYAQVKNISGVTLAKGTPVHATASASPPAGNISEVIAASASLASTMPATFILDEELANEAEGRAILSGFINGVDTSAFKEGDIVYVGPDGGYTTTKPTGTNLIQNLGIITKVDASNGAGYIYGSGRSNDVPNLLDNQIFFGSGSNQSQQIHISGALDATTINNITASGDISASGDLYSTHLFLPQGDTTTSGLIFGDPVGDNGYIYDDGGKLQIGYNDSDIISIHDTNEVLLVGGNTRITGNITASGNISSSGTITANGATFTGNLIVTGSQLITDDITSDGTIRARVKSFDIPHPTRKNKRLVYGALEGPEHGIYCRGESKELKVLLPPEWRAMVDKKGVSVQITPIGEWQPLYFKKLQNNWLYFGCGDDRENVHFYWEIKGERTDVPKLETVQ